MADLRLKTVAVAAITLAACLFIVLISPTFAGHPDVDVNRDGQVDIEDLASVAHAIGMPVPPYHLTSDVIDLGGVHPECAAVYEDYLYVVHFYPPVISKIDLTSFTLVDTLTLTWSDLGIPATSLETCEIDGSFLYIGATTDPGVVTTVELRTFTVSGAYQFPINGIAGMHRISLSLYVSGINSPVGVAKIATNSLPNATVLNFSAGELQAEESCDDGTYLYVPLQRSNQVRRIVLAGFTLDSVVDLPPNLEAPQECIVIGGYVYVAIREGSAEVGVVRLPTNDFTISAMELLEFLPSEMGAATFAEMDGNLYVFSDYLGGEKPIIRIDPVTFTKTGTIRLEGSASTGGPELLIAHEVYLYAADDTRLWRFLISSCGVKPLAFE